MRHGAGQDPSRQGTQAAEREADRRIEWHGAPSIARQMDQGEHDGAGLKFATSSDAMGQNTRAAAVIWQWQGIRHSVTVYPPVYATGTVGFIPLPR